VSRRGGQNFKIFFVFLFSVGEKLLLLTGVMRYWWIGQNFKLSGELLCRGGNTNATLGLKQLKLTFVRNAWVCKLQSLLTKLYCCRMVWCWTKDRQTLDPKQKSWKHPYFLSVQKRECEASLQFAVLHWKTFLNLTVWPCRRVAKRLD